jgi:hypothetical protein
VVKSRFGPIAKNAALVVASVLLTLVVCEMGTRVWFWRKARADVRRMMEDRTASTINTPVGVLGPGIRISPIPDIVYELKPNLTGTYDGRRYATNRFGFRQSHDTTREKAPGVVRIFGIGDSWMWGSGVDNGETYLDRLQELFDAEQPGQVEVENSGVWGYNTVQEVATLEWKGLLFAPDVVVIGLCGNDLSLPRFMTDSAYLSPYRSFLWSELRRRLHSPDPLQLSADADDFGENPKPEYRHLAGFDVFFKAYERLAELAKAHGFEVVVFSDCLTPSGKLPAQCHLGTPEQWTRWRQANAERWGFRECGYDINQIPQNYPQWGHATAEGNRRLAGFLHDCIVASPKYTPPSRSIGQLHLPVSSMLLEHANTWPMEADAKGPFVWTTEHSDFAIRGLVAGRRYLVTLGIVDAGGCARMTFKQGDVRDEVDVHGAGSVAWSRPLAAGDDRTLRFSLEVEPWRPVDRVPGSNDERRLGVAVSEIGVVEAPPP